MRTIVVENRERGLWALGGREQHGQTLGVHESAAGAIACHQLALAQAHLAHILLVLLLLHGQLLACFTAQWKTKKLETNSKGKQGKKITFIFWILFLSAAL